MDASVPRNKAKDPILRLQGLSKRFGGLEAVSDFTMTLERGELKGLIGPNGAGKSTLFHLISGLYKPTKGNFFLEKNELTGQTPDKIVARGIARTFQTVKLLENSSVLETMRTAFFMSYGYKPWDLFFHTKRYRRQEEAFKEKAHEYLSLLGVQDLMGMNGNELAYGLQRKVSIAMTLCLNPKILLLDEPMAGLTHTEKNELTETILRLKERFELSIILVEHDMKVIMNLCETIAVMNQGRLIAEGSGSEIRNNAQVVEAYLGTSDV
ncbi:MAG: ABC transporter ATP-binding protein [Desulfohalobiaceae bacterium]|nr:ABC transporter ATP-binding protein [Desulfohalobiaceae bacterium]